MPRVTNRLDQPMLRGLFTPLEDEIDAADLAVTGVLPPGLHGTFVRNGPNPMFEPRGGYHMFDGDGMLHRVVLGDGAPTYRNRWIRSAGLEAEVAAGRSIYGGLGEMYLPGPDEVGDAGPMKNPANTNIVSHAGRLLALYEAAPPTEVTLDLDTVGLCDFGGTLDSPFTAHPRIDPRTGDLHAFAYLPFPPFLRYHHIGADGRLVRSLDIELRDASIMHDFVVTSEHVVFVESPLLMDLHAALSGGSMFRWDPEHGTRVGILPIGGDEIRWFETEDGYVNHFWNGWTEGDVVTFSGSCLTAAAYTTGEGSAMSDESADAEPGRPTRFTVDLASGSVKQEQFDDLGGDFPRVNEALLGVRTRYHYMVGFQGTPDVIGHFDTIVRYDDQTGDRATWHAGVGKVAGEAVFAPDPDGITEDGGWLLSIVSERNGDGSDLVVLDARDVAAGPVASVRLPRRLPFGFHANWFPADRG
jgi:carotenoid cleavage dioxygenase-like enzyme